MGGYMGKSCDCAIWSGSHCDCGVWHGIACVGGASPGKHRSPPSPKSTKQARKDPTPYHQHPLKPEASLTRDFLHVLASAVKDGSGTGVHVCGHRCLRRHAGVHGNA